MRRIFIAVFCVLALMLAVGDDAFAAKKKKKKKKAKAPEYIEQVILNPNVDNLKYVSISTGAQIACYASDGQTFIPGATEDRNGATAFILSDPLDQHTIALANFNITRINKKKKKKLKPLSKSIREAKQAGDKKVVKKLKKKRKKRGAKFDVQKSDLQSQIDFTTALIAEKTAVCNGADPPTPNNLEPFAGTITGPMADRFLRVHAFGSGGQDAYVRDIVMNQGPTPALVELKTARAETGSLIIDATTTLSLAVYTTDMWDGEIDIAAGNQFQMGEEWDETGVRYALYADLLLTNNSLFRKRGLFLFNIWNIHWGITLPTTQQKWWDYLISFFVAAPDLDLKAVAANQLTSVMPLFTHSAPGNTFSSGINHALSEAILGNLLPVRVHRDETNPSTFGTPNVTNDDLNEMMKICSGSSVAELPGAAMALEYFGVFIPSEHFTGGPFTVNTVSAGKLTEFATEVFNVGSETDPSDLALYYSRRVLEDFLTDDANLSVELIKEGAKRLHQYDFKLGMLIDDIAVSAAFFSSNLMHTLHMYPYEAIVDLARRTGVPVDALDGGTRDIRGILDRTSYSITRTPAPYGYRRKDFANTYDWNRIRDGVEALFSNNGYFNFLEVNNLISTPWEFTAPTYAGVPNVFEILSKDLVKFVAGFLGLDPALISDNAMASYSNYVLFYPELNAPNGLYQPYNGNDPNIAARKGAGLVPALLGLYILM